VDGFVGFFLVHEELLQFKDVVVNCLECRLRRFCHCLLLLVHVYFLLLVFLSHKQPHQVAPPSLKLIALHGKMVFAFADVAFSFERKNVSILKTIHYHIYCLDGLHVVFTYNLEV